MLHAAALLLTACAAPLPEELPLAPPAVRERTVGILVFEGVELLDFAGPGEAFSATHGPDGHAFRVVTVASEKRPVVSQGFVTITPAYSLADCPPLDLLVLPGGHVPDDDRALVDWVRTRAQTAECVMSVCNGAFLLARAGLVDGLEITSHHSALEALTLQFPRVKVLTNRRFVDSGRVENSAGRIYDISGFAVGVGLGAGVVYDFLGIFPSLAYFEVATRVDRSDKLDDVQFLFGTRQAF